MSNYPTIEKATLLIALDNGGINRTRSAEQQLSELRGYLNTQNYVTLSHVEHWLANLTTAELETVCTDSESFPREIPAFVNDFLDDYFAKVC